MAVINQIYQLVNDAVDDALGGSNRLTSARSTTDFVSLGNEVASANAYEAFFGALSNRLVKTVYAVRVYEPTARGILRDETEWGAFKQKIHYELLDAVSNPAYNIPQIADGVRTYNQHSPYSVSTTIEIKSLLFGGQGTWSIEVIRPIAQVKTAFTNETEMAAFIDGIYIQIDNSMKLDMETLESLAANTGMALTILKGKKINLLTEYNNTVSAGNALTVSNCLYSIDFLRFAAQRITETVGYMGKMTKLYNAEGMPKFTPREDLVVEVLEKFASQSAFYLQSDTYHKELVELPRYNSVPFWQTSGSDFGFSDVSKISIQNDELIQDPTDDTDTGTVTQSGIVATLRDIDYVAAQFGERYSWDDINKRDRVGIHGEQARKGFGVDPNEQSVVFYIENSSTPPVTVSAGV